MGQVHPLPKDDHAEASQLGSEATVHQIADARCGLCGAAISAHSLRYHVVSPQSCDATVTVCHLCHRAALGEGYRPAQ
jgi:hypothetical protein